MHTYTHGSPDDSYYTKGGQGMLQQIAQHKNGELGRVLLDNGKTMNLI